MKEDNINSTNTSLDEEQINLKPFLKTLIRKKLFILLITSISTIVSIKDANSLDPIYKGSFEILVTGSKKSNSANTSIETLLGDGGVSSTGRTQELILKSPSVLKPIFNYVIESYSQKGIETENMTYKGWVKNELEIKFQEDSQVLSVTYFNKDRKFIKNVLNKISRKYQDFSKSDREQELNKTIKYLETQRVIYRKKALSALKELNKFSIENGMGDIDGKLAYGTSIKSSDNNINNEKGPQRFSGQFDLLETYESNYTDYSYKLKDNSKILKELKLKIENLRKSLKRPNEIILKFRELKNNSQNKYFLLNNMEMQLTALKLEKAKQLDPWQLISDPTVEKRKVSPNKRQIVAKGFLIAFVISSLIAILYEKIKGNLYEQHAIKRKISCKYLEDLYYDDLNLSSIIFKKNMKTYLKNKNSNNGLLFFNAENDNDLAVLRDSLLGQKANILKNKLLKLIEKDRPIIGQKGNILKNKLLKLIGDKRNQIIKESLELKIKKEKNDEFIKNLGVKNNLKIINKIDFLNNNNKIESFDNLFLIIESGEINIKDIIYINKYINAYDNKFVGWFFIEKTT